MAHDSLFSKMTARRVDGQCLIPDQLLALQIC